MTLSIRPTQPDRSWNGKRRSAKDDEEKRYPSSDGKPMAETPEHRDIMFHCIDAVRVLLRNKLVDGVYVPLELVDNRLYSEVLDAFLLTEVRFLRIVDAQTGETVLTTPERQARLMEAEAQIREASHRAEIAEAEAETESRRASDAEAENAHLRARLAALRAQTRENETG